jgi:tRNA (guanine37-N1)-methyltransferase
MRFDVCTLFPGIFSGFLGESLLNKAIAAGLVNVQLHDIRQWSQDKHQKVDDRPYGGGPGMVLMVEPVVACVESVQAAAETAGSLILLSPQGRKLDQALVEDLAGRQRLVLLCGRYEGFDQRVSEILQPEEISIGDYILNGGEVAAMAIIEAVIRLIPGVLGHDESSRRDSFSTAERWLEGPQYTRPREFRGRAAPEVLLSGNHEAIARWRQEQSWLKTTKHRSDLLAKEAPAATNEPTERNASDE